MAPVIQSYKKVINVIPASYGPGFSNIIFAQGTENATVGQNNATDGAVPTGAIIKYVEVQFNCINIVAGACFINTSLQYKLVGQNFVDPGIIGGNKQRNQVIHQQYYSAGENQSTSRTFKFKIPKRFQRVREGMDWSFTWSNSATVSAGAQVIYKFYR